MAEYTLGYSLESGKCYYISGTTSDVGGGESVLFELGDGITYETIGTITTNGGFALLFNYDGSPEYTKIKITVTGDLKVSDIKLRLQDQCRDKVCSECYRVDNCEPPHREHLLLEWTNNEDGLGFSYSMAFTQSLYIVGGIRNADYPTDEEIFSDSDQSRYQVYAASLKTKELWIHDLPEYIHDAIRLAVVHDDFYINGEKWVKTEGAYTPDWDTPNSLFAPCVVKIALFSQDTVNNSCA